jgi:hypothetical protein
MSNYVERYNIPFASKTNQGKIFIDEIDGSMSSEPLILSKDGITISTIMNDWDDPIITQTAEIDILNTRTNFFDLLPLLSAEERHYRIRINQTSPTTKYLFEGFLNSDIVEQTYLNKQPIRLVASNYTQKLDYVTPNSVNTLQKLSLIDLISQSLIMTGTDASIYVNMTICPSGGSLSTNYTPIGLTACNTEVFWQNNVDRDSGLDIITKILKPFNSYIFWWNGNWYIERYDDLKNYPQHYVGYDLDVSYGYQLGGASITLYDISTNIFSYHPIEKSQLLSINPGLNQLTIKYNDNLYDNLLYSDLSGLTSIDPGFIVQDRTWRYSSDPSYNFRTSDFGKPSGYISNSCWMTISPGLSGKNSESSPYFQYKYKDCLMGGFKCTIDSSIVTNPTNLSINWKWKPIAGSSPGDQTQYSPLVTAFKLRWYLKYANSYWLFHIDASKNYSLTYSTDNATGYNAFTILPTDLIKNENYIYEATISIPLSEVPGVTTGDQSLIFGLLLPSYTFNGTDYFVNGNIWGDVTATVTSTLQNNTFNSTINNKFLNKKTIELDLFDINSLNYKNGIYSGPYYPFRSSTWYDTEGVYLSIKDRLLKEKYRLYNKSRQSIKATIDCSTYLKPFSMWYDSNQSGKTFVLTSYSYYPTKNMADCVWSEYDENETVNLNYMN